MLMELIQKRWRSPEHGGKMNLVRTIQYQFVINDDATMKVYGN